MSALPTSTKSRYQPDQPHEDVEQVLRALSDWYRVVFMIPDGTPHTLTSAQVTDLRITIARATRAIRQESR